MAGIAVQPNISSRNAHSIARQKSELPTVPRKTLGEIQNVLHSKSVGFDKQGLKSGKMKLDAKGQTPGPRKMTGHRDRIKNSTSRIKPNKGKAGPTPSSTFKIYEDSGINIQRKKKIPVESIEILEKEYMPPCTDKEFEIPMADYLQRALDHVPSYNIDFSAKMKPYDFDKVTEQAISEAFIKELPEPETEDTDDITDSIMQSLLTSPERVDDKELLYYLDHDDSFSLEDLDRELRAANLEVPEWL